MTCRLRTQTFKSTATSCFHYKFLFFVPNFAFLSFYSINSCYVNNLLLKIIDLLLLNVCLLFHHKSKNFILLAKKESPKSWFCFHIINFGLASSFTIPYFFGNFNRKFFIKMFLLKKLDMQPLVVPRTTLLRHNVIFQMIIGKKFFVPEILHYYILSFRKDWCAELGFCLSIWTRQTVF